MGKCENGHIISGSYCFVCEEKPEKKKQTPIKKVSEKHLVRLSDGSKITRIELKNRINKAKQKLTDNAKKDKKEFCWACGKKFTFLSWSHVIAVSRSINDGRADFAYYLPNMKLECTEKCHIETEINKIEHHNNYQDKKEVIELYENTCK